MSLQYLRIKRSFGDIFNDGIGFLRLHYRSLARILLYLVGPILIASSVLSGYNTYMLYNSSSINLTGLGIAGILAAIASLLSYTVATLVIYVYLQDSYAGINHTIGSMWKAIRGRILPVIGHNILLAIIGGILYLVAGMVFAFLAMLLGPFSVLLIFFGLVLFIPFFVASAIIVLDKVGAATALSRAYYLFNGNWWFSFKVVLATMLMTFSISMFFTLITTMLSGSFAMFTLHQSSNPVLSAIIVILSFLSPIISIATWLPGLCVMAFFYYSLSEEKDFTGLYERIGNLTLEDNNAQPESPEYEGDF